MRTSVVALPRRDAPRDLSERTARERGLIARLSSLSFPFRLPEIVGTVPDGEHLALVRKFSPGVTLDLRAGREGAVRPWDVVAEIAAAVHRVPGEAVSDLLPGAATYAIVTRGVKRPFQIADGLVRLLDAYRHHGGLEVKPEHVRIHELAMIAEWYRTALNERGPNAPAQELDRMRGLLRRLR